MKRKEIVERIAQEREVPLHQAADWLDAFIHELIQQLKDQAKPEEPDPQRRAPTAKGRQ